MIALSATLLLVIPALALAFDPSRLLDNTISDKELSEIEKNLPKKFFRVPQDVKNIDEHEILLDSYHPLNEADFRRAKYLSPKDLSPPDDSLLYSPDLFEGDIFGPLKGRNAIIDMSATWPEGRIPYVVSRRLTERDRAVLAAAIQTYNDKTCIRYVPKNSTDNDFVYIYPGGGCASQVGRAGGMQYVSLGLGCSYLGITQHELMHVTGFWHEQSRADRDQFIRILWENIEPGMEYNFDKYTWNDIQSLEEPYDYGSVMHYGTHAFAKGFGPTIQPVDGVPRVMGQRVGLSDTDLEKINKLYGCKAYLRNKNFVLSQHAPNKHP